MATSISFGVESVRIIVGHDPRDPANQELEIPRPSSIFTITMNQEKLLDIVHKIVNIAGGENAKD